MIQRGVKQMGGLSEGIDCARLYLSLMLPIMLALNLLFPPFHAPDDDDHLKRAHLLARGIIWPQTEPGTSSGGEIDASLAAYMAANRHLYLERPWSGIGPENSKSEAERRAAVDLSWSSDRVYSSFPGSVSYLPLVYLPQAIALAAAEFLDFTVDRSVLIARFANGGAAAVIVAGCIAFLPFGRLTVMFVMLLPKTQLQFASNSADPMLHAMSLVVMAFAAFALSSGRRPGKAQFSLVAVALLVAAGARPPLAALALLPLWVAWVYRSPFGVAVTLFAVLLPAGWYVAVLPEIVDVRLGMLGSNWVKLVRFATDWPVLIGETIRTYWVFYIVTFIGDIGWSDPFGGSPARMLPRWIYVMALAIFFWVLWADLVRPGAASPPLAIVSLVTATALGVLIFVAMLLAATSERSDLIQGVQGRYFVTSFLLLALVFPALSSVRGLQGGWLPSRVPLTCFALAGFGCLIQRGLYVYWVT